MKRILINLNSKKKLNIAFVNKKKLYNLNMENLNSIRQKSNIYRGKIVRIEPSLEAVFIDYGSKKNGFLPFKKIVKNYFSKNFMNATQLNIQNILTKGQNIIVQINKEERGNKGATLTTFISLSGNYLVLLPNSPNIKGISKKIKGLNRVNLKKIISMLVIPHEMGLIIRTSGVEKSIEVLQLDLNFCLKNWFKIKKFSKNNLVPHLIHQENNVLISLFKDYLQEDIQEIIIDHPKILNLIHQCILQLNLHNLTNKIKLYTGNTSLFNYYQIASQIDSIFQRKIKLPSGGSIVVDTTEALTVIDINSEHATKGINIEETAFNTNLEAVKEIMKQLRLRNLGGLIVIDFIDMNLLKNKKLIELQLRNEFFKDKACIQIGSISRFGLLEMSRQRLGLPLKKSDYYICS